MNKLIAYLFEIGFEGSVNFFSSYGHISTTLKHPDGREVEWGLHLYGKPPMLIHPQPRFYFGNGAYFMDGETTDLNIDKFTPEQIVDSMFNKTVLDLSINCEAELPPYYFFNQDTKEIELITPSMFGTAKPHPQASPASRTS